MFYFVSLNAPTASCCRGAKNNETIEVSVQLKSVVITTARLVSIGGALLVLLNESRAHDHDSSNTTSSSSFNIC